MSTVSLGPFTFSGLLFISLLAVLVAMFAGWALDRKLNTNVESMVWRTALAAVFAGRTVFVILYFDVYAQRPVSMIDLRDGGFSIAAAVAAAVLMVFWFLWRKPLSRKPLLLSCIAGLSALGIGYASLNLLNPPRSAINDVMMTTLDGEPLPISQFHGKPTVINLWATWCPPCRREMPALQDGQNANPDIHFVFANQRESASIVDAYLTTENLSLDNVLLDSHGNLAQDMKTRGLPTTLFLDTKGRLVDIRLGELSRATLQERLDALRSDASKSRSSKE